MEEKEPIIMYGDKENTFLQNSPGKPDMDQESFFNIDKKECRICLDEGYDTENDPFMAPCFCSGTSKYVHKKCLNQWRATHQNPRAFTNCAECGFEYQLQLIRREEKKGKWLSRKGKFRYLVARDTVVAFAFIQTVVILLGVIIRAVDSTESLVDFLGFRELPDEQPSWKNTYQHHKTTYYLAGFLTFLFCLGLGYTCHKCVHPNHSLHSRSVRGGDCCTGCYWNGPCFIDCPSGGGGGGKDDDCWKIFLILLIIFVVIMIFIGIIVGIFLFTLFIQRVVQRHYHVLQKKVLAKEYQVVDLDALEGSDIEVVVDKPRPEPSAPLEQPAASAPDEALMASPYSSEGGPKFKTEQQRNHYIAARELGYDLSTLSFF